MAWAVALLLLLPKVPGMQESQEQDSPPPAVVLTEGLGVSTGAGAPGVPGVSGGIVLGVVAFAFPAGVPGVAAPDDPPKENPPLVLLSFPAGSEVDVSDGAAPDAAPDPDPDPPPPLPPKLNPPKEGAGAVLLVAEVAFPPPPKLNEGAGADVFLSEADDGAAPALPPKLKDGAPVLLLVDPEAKLNDGADTFSLPPPAAAGAGAVDGVPKEKDGFLFSPSPPFPLLEDVDVVPPKENEGAAILPPSPTDDDDDDDDGAAVGAGAAAVPNPKDGADDDVFVSSADDEDDDAPKRKVDDPPDVGVAVVAPKEIPVDAFIGADGGAVEDPPKEKVVEPPPPPPPPEAADVEEDPNENDGAGVPPGAAPAPAPGVPKLKPVLPPPGAGAGVFVLVAPAEDDPKLNAMVIYQTEERWIFLNWRQDTNGEVFCTRRRDEWQV